MNIENPASAAPAVAAGIPRRRTLASCAALALALVPLVLSAQSPAQSPAQSHAKSHAQSPAKSPAQTAAVPRIAWQPCGPQFPGVECATVSVPLDYDLPDGARTSLALARVPASDRAKRIGSLFVNPGGPGGSGVDLIKSGFGTRLDGALLGRFDIVGWDPRGVGESTPIRCWDSEAARGRFFAGLPAFPYLPEQERPYHDRNSAMAAQCLSRGQAIVRHMSTADVVRDLDLLRQAVGDARLNYIGYSYGSFIGNTYANLYPSKVRALVIDGVLNPALWSSGWQIASDRRASFDVLKEFFRLCDRAGVSCPLSGGAGAEARFNAVRDLVRETPLIINDGSGGSFVYSYDRFVSDSAGVMYTPEIWPLYAEFIDLLNDALFGDAAAAVRALQVRRSIVQSLTPKSSAREVYDNGLDAFYGNHCADAEYPGFFQTFSLIGKFAEAGSFQGPQWWWGNTRCARWPTAQDRYIGPWSARTSAPVLVVGNFFDAATDYAGAVASNRLLPNSRLLSYAGWGHTVSYVGRSQCVDDYVTLYLIDGSLPPRGTVCPAASNPLAATRTDARSKTAGTMPMVGLPSLEQLEPR